MTAVGSIDLHVHTTISDGTLTPRQVVRYAKKKGLKAIAITDHDSTEGNKEALDEGAAIGLIVIPGMEISVKCQYGPMHLLGFCIDIRSSYLREKLNLLTRARQKRNSKILQKLKDIGITLDSNDIYKIMGGKQIGRLHIASALMKRGYAATRKEAFERFLKKGGPVYVDRFRFHPKEAISLVLKSHGFPVLAHPSTLTGLDPEELDGFIGELVMLGLKGIEAYYPDHTDEQVLFFEKLAKKYGILATGGSDYHGNNKPEIEMGVYRGDTRLAFSVIDTIRKFKYK